MHCFADGDVPAQLQAVTQAVYFYRPSKSPMLLFSRLPFSVASRNRAKLLQNLQKIDAPILFEGLKTTFVVNQNALPNRPKILRLHNIEQDYFAGIAKSENSWLRKFLFGLESRKYKRYEGILSRFDRVATLSLVEHGQMQKRFGNSVYVPVFHGNQTVKNLGGLGQNVLYHGDLGTADNIKSALFLIESFREMPDIELVIASGTRNAEVDKAVSATPNARFEAFDTFEQLQDLFDRAHINISWSFQRSGTKLKVINALFNGRHSVINENITDDENLVGLCHVAKTKGELKSQITRLMNVAYDDVKIRSAVLARHFDDVQNAKSIAALLT